MLKIFKNFNINIIALILLVIYCIWASLALQNYQKIDKNNIPAFIIQESKLSPKPINDFAKIGDAKNIWLIADDKDFKKANELIKQSADAISYANQIGRLDLVSIFLAIIAVILGLFGIVGFLHVKAMVQAEIDRIAPVETKAKIVEIAPEEIKTYLDQQFGDNGDMTKKVEDLTKKLLKKQSKYVQEEKIK